MIGQFKFTNARLMTDFRSNTNILTLDIPSESLYATQTTLDELSSDITYLAEIKPCKARKTLSQNAYLWVLCQRISEKLHATKEEVYRMFIRRKGQFDMVCCQDKALSRFIANWQNKGIGWVCETDTSKLDGCTNVICYYGTSVYSKQEMQMLLDEVVSECRNLNISCDVYGYEEEN